MSTENMTSSGHLWILFWMGVAHNNPNLTCYLAWCFHTFVIYVTVERKRDGDTVHSLQLHFNAIYKCILNAIHLKASSKLICSLCECKCPDPVIADRALRAGAENRWLWGGVDQGPRRTAPSAGRDPSTGRESSIGPCSALPPRGCC